jgi:penicillin amidase
VRDANDPADAWDGFLDFDALPRVENPARGWVATANNVPWHRDPGYIASGAWSDGYRARRIRLRLTAKERLAPEEVAAVQGDTMSGRAADLVPALLELVAPGGTAQERQAIRALQRWDGDQTLESVGASVWTAFWVEWTRELARARFPALLVETAALRIGNVARHLLLGERLPWLDADPAAVVRRAFAAALAKLERVAGPNPGDWRWGRLHRVTHPHPLAITPDLAALLNTGPYPTTGGQSVRAAGFNLGVPFPVTSGSTYRFMADLSRPDRLISVQTLGQSAHPASPHYRDQTRLWLENRYHPFWMDDAEVEANLESETRIRPGSPHAGTEIVGCRETGVGGRVGPASRGHSRPAAGPLHLPDQVWFRRECV